MAVELTVAQAASIVGGEVAAGDGQAIIRRVMPVHAAARDAVTFVTRSRFLCHLPNSDAAAVLVNPRMLADGDVTVPEHLAVVHVERPYVAYARLAQALAAEIPRHAGVHPSAVIEPGATVAPDASVGAHAYVGPGASVGPGAVLYPGAHVEAGASVGAGTILYNHVVIRHGCTVGQRCILHPGVVVGADGFGFAQQPRDDGPPVDHIKIPQVGDVVIEDDVEIGANTCIDRGAMGTTRLGEGTKIDNLVQIGHNVEIGPRGILVAQSGVAGSSRLGTAVTLGAQSGISGHVEIGSGATVYGQSGVMENLDAGATVAGTPSVPARSWFRQIVRLGQIERLARRVKKIEQQLSELIDGNRS